MKSANIALKEEKQLQKNCKDCGKPLDIFERIFERCDNCAHKRAYSNTGEKRQADRMLSQQVKPFATEAAQISRPKIELSWVEVMINLAWILCFCAAAVFALMALASATDRGEQGAVAFFTACAISLTVSGVLFAAVGKVISTLTSINVNLNELASHSAGGMLRSQEGSKLIL